MSGLIVYFLPIEMQATVIDPADVGALESALDKNNVSIEESGYPLINILSSISNRFSCNDYHYYWMQVTLFFTESPTNPFLRCVDIKLSA